MSARAAFDARRGGDDPIKARCGKGAISDAPC